MQPRPASAKRHIYRDGMTPARRLAVIVLALLPALALTIAIPLANHAQPSLGGAPFLLLWIIGWVIATPLCLYCVYRLEHRA